MNIKKLIRKIVDDGEQEKMEELAIILDEVIEDMKEFNQKDYDKYKMKLYIMAYGEHLNEDMAEEIVSKMRPYGQKWNIEETDRIKQENGIQNIDNVDFYIVMNQGFNDYRNLFDENISNYVRYTEAFINDEDAKPNKVFRYFIIVPE